MYSVQIETSDGTLTRINLGIQYFEKNDVTVYRNEAEVPLGLGTDWQWDGDNTIVLLKGAEPVGNQILVFRNTDKDRAFNIYDGGAPFSRDTLDENFKQMIYLAQEFTEGSGIAGLYRNLNMHGNRVINLGDPIAALDAANKKYVDAQDAFYDIKQSNWNARQDDDIAALKAGVVDQTSHKTVPWLHIAVGGETTISPPFVFQSALVFINGVNQYELGNAYSIANNTVTLAEPLLQGDEVLLYMGSRPAVPNEYLTLSEVASIVDSKIDAYDDGIQPHILDAKQHGTYDIATSGSIRRAIDQRFKEMISVRDFNVVGDGVADDTAAIQAAVNAAVLTGSELIFPAGIYKVSSTIVATGTIRMRGVGMSLYDKTAKILAGLYNMVIFKFEGPENYIDNMVIQDAQTDLSDLVNGYGQAGTCTGLQFLRSNGSKDIDSYVVNSNIVGCLIGIEATGANLKVTGSIFTACRFPLDYRAAATSPADFRGFVVDSTRFHKCGGNGATTDAVCIKTTGTFKNSQLTNLFVDAGSRCLYVGALAEGSVIRGVVSRYATSDLITVDNTGITPSAAYQHYQISDISFQTPTGAPSTAGGWAVRLINAPGGSLSDISTTFTRGGAVFATNSSEIMMDGIFVRNFNVDYVAAGTAMDAVQLVSSTDVQISNMFVRNTLSASQARSVINLDAASSCNIRQVSYINVTNLYTGAGVITGERFNARSAPSITYGTAIPTSGSYRTGSIHVNTSAVGGGPGMWICITAGAPGAWRALQLQP